MRPCWTICAVCLLLCVVLAGCNRNRLPEDPGLAVDDLGVGIRLGMSFDEAKGKSNAEAEFWVITRDELVKRSPYTEKPEGRDLVVALYTEYPPGTTGMDMAADFGVISEIRCYLGKTTDSPVTFLGYPAAGMTPEGMREVLGEPEESVVASDGNTHLTYRFARIDEEGKKDPKRVVRLTTSHNARGNCFALLVALDRID